MPKVRKEGYFDAEGKLKQLGGDNGDPQAVGVFVLWVVNVNVICDIVILTK